MVLLVLNLIPKDKTVAKQDSRDGRNTTLSPTINKAVKAISTPTPTITKSTKQIFHGNKEEQSVEVSNQKKAEFYYERIPASVKMRIVGKSYGEKCDVPMEDLRYVTVLYWGFDNQSHRGELTVNRKIASDIVDIFQELYKKKYPIERIELVDNYNADDDESMAANNTSSFNYRNIDGTKKISLHSYGLAIDINPLYNPYVREHNGKTVITPVNGMKYADRSLDNPYYIKKDDVIYRAFIKKGFTWGGEWKTQKDYQHFQKTFD